MTATRATRAEWANRVEAWRQSGQTSREFCVDRGYTAKTLLWYSSRLGREAKRSRVPMVRVQRAPATTPVVVELDGARVHVEVGVDVGTLTTVFEALRGAKT